MKIKITASLFALTTFTLFAQPSLPTTNAFIVPIANPYSGSWIYYTTNAASGLDFLNGASIPFVMTVSNNIADLMLASGANSTNYTLSTSNLLYLAAQNYANGIGENATNYTLSTSNLLSLAAQSFANGIGANATNYTLSASNFLSLAAQSFANGIGANATNYTLSTSNLLILAAQSFANGIGANATNYTLSTSNLLSLAAQNFANDIGANATNYTLSVSNSLAALATGANTWGTTNNKPSGAAPATVYYYFTNGAPMFGIISTNY